MLQETGFLSPEALQRAAERAAKRKHLRELIEATKARQAVSAPAASEDDAARRQLGWKPAEEQPEEKQPLGQQPMEQGDHKAAAPAPALPQGADYTRRAAANFLARLSQNGDRLKTLPPKLQDALRNPDRKAEMIQLIHSAAGDLGQIVACFQKEQFVASRTRDNMALTPLTRVQLEQIYGPELRRSLRKRCTRASRSRTRTSPVACSICIALPAGRRNSCSDVTACFCVLAFLQPQELRSLLWPSSQGSSTHDGVFS